MRSCKNLVVSMTASIQETLYVIDRGSQQIALVTDDEGRLVGTVTDGDIRRAILNKKSLDLLVTSVMNPNPIIAYQGDTREKITSIITQNRIHQLPIISQDGILLGFETIDELLKPESRDNVVVLMAGGLGSRLRPLTELTPKPMLKIGGRPILETILQQFIAAGFNDFYLAVNYKAHLIESYFGDGSKWGASIRYLKETDQGGTAGALSLLPKEIELPVIVMNGDIMTRVNMEAFLNFHVTNQAGATLCVREYSQTIPFGVVEMRDNIVAGIVEKPVNKCFVNAGIYVLNPQILKLIPKGVYYGMPDLLQDAAKQGFKVVGFPIHEYWLDIGRFEDFEKAHIDFMSSFPLS